MDRSGSSIRPYASALSAGVLLRASSAHADDRDQLKSIQPTSPPQRAIKQQQQQRASLLAQLKAQEEAIAAAARKLRETRDSLNQLNKQIDEMNAALAKLERQRASQERNLAAQLDAAFRRGIPASRWCSAVKRASAISGCRSISAISTSPPETIAELKKTREEMAVQKSMLEENRASSKRWSTSKRPSRRSWSRRVTNGKDPFRPESSIQQGQQQLSELRANESRLRGRIAAEAAAKARADREARDAQAVRDRQQEASRKGTTYKPTESERSLMSRTGGLARRAVRRSGRFAVRSFIDMANSCKVNYVGKGWLSPRLKAPKSEPLPMVGSFWPTGCRAMVWWWWSNMAKAT